MFSIRIVLVGSLLILATLSFGIAIYGGDVYYDLAVDAQRQSTQRLLAVKSDDMLADLQEHQKVFALKLQKELQLAEVLRDNRRESIETLLEQSFRRYFVTAGVITLSSVIVRDPSFNTLAVAFGNGDTASIDSCGQVRERFNAADARTRLKPLYVVCSHAGMLHSEVVVPIGTFAPSGYLHIASPLKDALMKIEASLRIPIDIETSDGTSLHRSPDWDKITAAPHIVATHRIKDTQGDHSMLLQSAIALDTFEQRISEAKNRFLLVLLVGAGVTLALALIIGRSIYMPLTRLRASAGAILKGKYFPVNVRNVPVELKDTVAAFNNMIRGLEQASIKRFEAEEELRHEKDFIETTLASISNGVIVLDNQRRIQILNPAAERILRCDASRHLGATIEQCVTLYHHHDKSTRAEWISILSDHDPSRDEPVTFFIPFGEDDSIEIEYTCSVIRDDCADTQGHVVVIRDVTEDRRLRRKLSYDARHDRLTGLLNRRAFEQHFEELIADETHDTRRHVLVYLDLDQFKVVNDTCGHAAGDTLLQQITEILQQSTRQSDYVARLGGDEFALILPYCSVERASSIVSALIQKIIDFRFYFRDKAFSVGVSAGIATFGDADDSLSDKMAAVDSACYVAKQAGGNQFHLYQPDDATLAAHQQAMDWVAGINKGLSEDRFMLYVQPIAPIGHSGVNSRYEILIRYRDDDDNIIPPGAFLPAAERYNLIERIDRWVLQSTIRWLETARESMPDLQFSINISGRSIGSADFQAFAEHAVTSSRIRPGSLSFEITETAIVADVGRSIEFIECMREHGVRFALDDFGSGLSSFSYLKTFPVDILKIDGSFVKELLEDPNSYVFIRSITEVGHCLGMKVVAEYVESEKMYHLLREAKVDYAQGWAVGKPKPIESLLGETKQPAPNTFSASTG